MRQIGTEAIAASHSIAPKATKELMGNDHKRKDDGGPAASLRPNDEDMPLRAMQRSLTIVNGKGGK